MEPSTVIIGVIVVVVVIIGIALWLKRRSK